MGVLNKPTKEPQKGLPQAFFWFQNPNFTDFYKKNGEPIGSSFSKAIKLTKSRD